MGLSMNYLIGIAGGSGSGKSTLAYGLQDRFPKLIEVIHFDDYQKPTEQIPLLKGIKNWDHPEAIDFEKLLIDLNLLRGGKDVEVMTKSIRHNPEYGKKEWKRVPYVMKAKDIVIVEGYMTLTDERIRRLCNLTIFLDLCHEERMRRRTKFINPEYTEKILLPMYIKYVEPIKGLIDIIVDTKQYDSDQVQELVFSHLKERGML